MNRDATVELFLKGREAWNAWAEGLLAERKALEDAGTWKLRREYYWDREKGENLETRTWLDKAAANFSSCFFLLQGMQGTKKASNSGDGPPVISIELEGKVIRFSGFVFPGDADFKSATFTGNAAFESATFAGGANFVSTAFVDEAVFESATFMDHADFGDATFTGGADFGRATFMGGADFMRATFRSFAFFRSATFTGNASFWSATFADHPANFESTTFAGRADFVGATFEGNADFGRATFTGNANFGRATFRGDAGFISPTFAGNAIFRDAQFKKAASFALASFKQYASFASSRFGAEASFSAIRGERGFDMAGAKFEAVPDFIQAHFDEAPRLDNLKVHGYWIPRHPRPKRKEEYEEEYLELESELAEAPELKGPVRWRWAAWYLAGRLRIGAVQAACGKWHEVRHMAGRARTRPVRAAKGLRRRIWQDNSSIPARWRALKRLAIQGHDAERELEYHARELQSQRFETDWPWPPLLFWRLPAWVGFLRFWSGFLYGLFSDFGRSIFRPFLFWWATIALFALYFLSVQPYTAHPAQPLGYTATALFYAKLAPALWRAPPPCYRASADEDGKPAQDLTGLVEPVAASTNAVREAFRLAIRNGSVILDGGEDAVHRTYGCLYGVARYNGNPVPFVPGFVTDASGLQKVLSALYIFLFGLALRNMLKMK
jgi:hypothetical protein